MLYFCCEYAKAKDTTYVCYVCITSNAHHARNQMFKTLVKRQTSILVCFIQSFISGVQRHLRILSQTNLNSGKLQSC